MITRFSVVSLFVVTSVFAQSTTSLRGVVADPSGALITDALLTLTNSDNGSKRATVSNGSGEYQFLQVSPGGYTITVKKPGFATLTRTGLQLLVNTPTTLDLSMMLSTTGESVNVTSDISQVNTTDATVGNPFGERQVRQLPLQTRNVVELLSLQPGVTATGEVLGARRDQNNITLDGADVNNNQNSGLVAQATGTATGGYQGSNANGAIANSGFNAVLPIPLDSVQEFRVTVAGEGPNQGRSSGGQVVLVTKSGTNQIHGSLYEFNRNTATAANTWFNNQAGVPRQPLVRNQFGGSVGGPIKRDRVFYFFNYEERRDASGVAQVRAVPSDSLRAGNLTFAMADGSIQTLTPADIRQVDPLHQGVNPNILKLLNQYPEGNSDAYGQDGGLNFSGYRFNAPSSRRDKALVGKLDFHIDPAGKHVLSVRGTLAHNTDDQMLAQFPGQAPASTLRDHSKGLAAQYTAILRPNLINTCHARLHALQPRPVRCRRTRCCS